MVSTIDNGKNLYTTEKIISLFDQCGLENERQQPKMEMFEYSPNIQTKISLFDQFRILLMRMWLQMWRNKSYLLLKVVLHIAIGLLIGNMYIGIGSDGSKTIFNFGFYFTCVIFFMYVPMMPVLLSCKWYTLFLFLYI